MTDAIHDRPVRPLPGSESAQASIRPRTWRDAFHGWPEGLPVDRRLRDRVNFELSRTSVQQDLRERTGGILKANGRASIALSIAWGAFIPMRMLAESVLGDTLLAILIPMVIVAPICVFVTVRATRHVFAPRLRAGLRREGIDCCVGCGHLIGRGRPADTCPECSRDHEDFPLGWGPGHLNAPGAAGAPRHDHAADPPATNAQTP